MQGRAAVLECQNLAWQLRDRRNAEFSSLVPLSFQETTQTEVSSRGCFPTSALTNKKVALQMKVAGGGKVNFVLAS